MSRRLTSQAGYWGMMVVETESGPYVHAEYQRADRSVWRIPFDPTTGTLKGDGWRTMPVHARTQASKLARKYVAQTA